MGRRRLPANGTQTYKKNVTNKKCIKTVINGRLKKLIARLMRLKKLIAWHLEKITPSPLVLNAWMQKTRLGGAGGGRRCNNRLVKVSLERAWKVVWRPGIIYYTNIQIKRSHKKYEIHFCQSLLQHYCKVLQRYKSITNVKLAVNECGHIVAVSQQSRINERIVVWVGTLKSDRSYAAWVK